MANLQMRTCHKLRPLLHLENVGSGPPIIPHRTAPRFSVRCSPAIRHGSQSLRNVLTRRASE
jgi:hypothetical protein